MVIKPAGKIALIILFLVLAFFTYRYFVPKTDTTTAEVDKTESGSASEPKSEGGSAEKTSTEKTTKSGSSENRSFSYVPEKPVNGVLRGVVEVGASGFNSFVINMDREKRWEIVSKD